MGACAYGATPRPELANSQRWLTENDLPISLLTLLRRFSWVGIAVSAYELIDFNSLCAANPDPPAAFTLEDWITASRYTMPGSPTMDPQLAWKIVEWARYGAFQASCVCNAAPAPAPGVNCIPTQASLTIAGSGVSQVWPVHIDDYVRSWQRVVGGTDWEFYRSGGAGVAGASSPANLFVEVQNVSGGWTAATNIAALNADLVECNRQGIQNATTQQWAQDTQVRLRNNATFSQTVTGFGFCFCAPPPTPPPLPTNDPQTNVPDRPPYDCQGQDLCALVSELMVHLSNIGTQVSDLQAQITQGDVLRILSTQAISGEGEVVLAPGTRAVSLELSGVAPPVYTSALGRPRGLMRAGSIRWGNGTAYTERTFIDAELFTRPRPPNVTSLSYQLINDVTASLSFLG